MRPLCPVENLYAAVWKSAVTEVLARHLGRADPKAGLDADQPLVAATDRYLEAFAEGRTLPPPDPGKQDLRDDDPDVAAYLGQLHHRLAHARIAGNKPLEAELARQRERFRFGNPLWERMLVQYYEYYWQYPFHLGGQPHYRSWQSADAGAGEIDYGVVRWRLPRNARIALVGDIGTGTDVAAAVLVAALSFRPDAILHVGDVYYSGTRYEFAHRFAGLFETVFRSHGTRVPVFTVPGNHEYFTGGIAFLECLDSGCLALSEDQRQAASYFCLRSADDGWQFLGLDTGFHGHSMSIPASAQKDALRLLQARSPALPLDPPSARAPASTAGPTAELPIAAPQAEDGAVALRDDEVLWHRHKIEAFGGRTILLSHHQLYSAALPCGQAQGTLAGPDGKPVPDPSDFNRAWIDTALWRQLGSHFGERVAAWFWGHEHNLGIFQDGYRPADWPGAAEASGAFRTLPKGRCVGHSAIPVQDKEQPYARNYPVPLKDDTLQLALSDGWYNRGFEILELAGAGQPALVRYFQIANADPTPLLIHEEMLT